MEKEPVTTNAPYTIRQIESSLQALHSLSVKYKSWTKRHFVVAPKHFYSNLLYFILQFNLLRNYYSNMGIMYLFKKLEIIL